MSFGGDEPQAPASQTVTQTNLPEWVRPYVENTLKTGENLLTSQNEYPQYNAPRYATLGPLQQSAINMNVDTAGTNPWQMDAASQMAMGSGAGALQWGNNYQPRDIGLNYTDMWNPWSQQKFNYYNSPYQQGVTDIALREAQRSADIATRDRGAKAAQAKAFGGYRHGIEQAEADRNTAMLRNDIQTKGLQSSWADAQQQFERDRSSGISNQQFIGDKDLQAQIESERNRVAAGQLGLGYLGQANTAANTLSNLGTGVRNMDRQSMLDLERQGALVQGDLQSQYDIGYQDWINQQAYPRQMLNWYAGLTRGYPVTSSTDVATYQGTPNPYSQLLGLGLTGAGMYKLFSGSGGGGGSST